MKLWTNFNEILAIYRYSASPNAHKISVENSARFIGFMTFLISEIVSFWANFSTQKCYLPY